ncbi:MAG: hypothetical protein QM541_10980 [Flavobacterium sp.]|nr:hypothetical protein [Flavobacterium sp.]
MQVQSIKYTLLDKIGSIDDEDLLNRINDLVKSVDINTTIFKVTDKQKAMLLQSENDIIEGKLLSNDAINIQEDEWLKV